MKMTVYDEDGELIEIEALQFYQLEEYDHEYVLYTKGEEANKDNMYSYLSIINQISENEFRFERITDPEEERKVGELVDRDIEETINQR